MIPTQNHLVIAVPELCRFHLGSTSLAPPARVPPLGGPGGSCVKLRPPKGRTLAGGFTIIELLVVIAIMAVLAALTVGLSRHASTHKKNTRVQAELQKWVTMIDNYHQKIGAYPPCNTNDPAVSPLFYELVGTINAAGTYTTLTSGETLTINDVNKGFSLPGFLNTAVGNTGDPGDVTSFGRNIGAADLTTVIANGATLKVPLVPADGFDPNVKNTWHYMCITSPKYPLLHNPNSYDLWAEVSIGGETNVFGNWKR